MKFNYKYQSGNVVKIHEITTELVQNIFEQFKTINEYTADELATQTQRLQFEADAHIIKTVYGREAAKLFEQMVKEFEHDGHS